MGPSNLNFGLTILVYNLTITFIQPFYTFVNNKHVMFNVKKLPNVLLKKCWPKEAQQVYFAN